MGKVERKATGMETLFLLNCPCCNGEIEVSECGYSSFNPGTAKCVGQCKREWELGYVNDQWDCGKIWNKLSAEIKRRLAAFELLKVNNPLTPSRDFAHETLAKEAEVLLKELKEYLIGSKT